jgi:hypothetical protein
MYLLYIFPLSPTHTYDFVVLTSLTHPRKNFLVVLQTGKLEMGKAKDFSAHKKEKSIYFSANTDINPE